MASTQASSLSVHPWARNAGGEESLKDILARVNLERGHFRDITEASLQEEIAAEGGLEISESEDDEDDEEEEVEEPAKANAKPSNREELFKAKYEMLANVRAAEQEILMSLDFVSLLLSKDAPKQAITTISPVLKESVPLGSLGTDLWQRMPVDKAREAQDEVLATKVRMAGFQESADSLLAAAHRLQDNVRKETEYWNQILSVSEKGWNISRIPGQQHKLGVRFGFNESATQFSRKGIAALNASPDGTIALEHGIGSRPQALRAVLRRNGNVIGTSILPDVPDPEETTLEARIRYARDSLFDEELCHEMIRESRSLTSLGASMKGSAVHFKTNTANDNDIEVSFDLVSLDEDNDPHHDFSDEEDLLAQAVVLASRLLLSHAHRDRLKKRSQIPPPLSDKQNDEKPLLPILRPIMSFAMHHLASQRMNKYMGTIAKLLQLAQIQHDKTFAQFGLPRDSDIPDSEALAAAFMAPWHSEAHLEMQAQENNKVQFSFKIDTTLAFTNSFGPTFMLTSPTHSEGYRIDNFEELAAAADAKIASALAKSLESMVGEAWAYDENEALLIKENGTDENDDAIWVQLDYEQKVLSLNSASKNVAWMVDGDEQKSSFWDAARDFVSLSN